MTSLVWVNSLLAAAFLLVWVGIPLWLVFKRRETAHDHSQAHAYLAAKEELASAERVGAAGPRCRRARKATVAPVGRTPDRGNVLESGASCFSARWR